MTHFSKLKNGLKVVKIPMLGTKAVTVMVMLPVGSRYEDQSISGASHFVEHLMFKGTKKRPTALDLSKELDAYGASYNAFTSQEYTAYYIKIDNTKTALAFDLLSDMVFNSKLEEKEIEKEKGVIVEELRMYEDNPTMDIDSLFTKAIFGDMSLGRDVGGIEKTVRDISREQLWNYYKGSYVPENMVLVVAGNLNKKTDSLISKYFGSAQKSQIKKWFNENKYEKVSWPKRNLPLEKRVAVKQKDIDQAHVILGFPGIKLKDSKRYVGSVLFNILGSSMSSRLFVEIREKRGLAYMIRAGMDSFRDTGSVQIQSGLDPSRLSEAFKVIRKELQKIKKEKISDKELIDAKNNLIGRLTLSLEDSSVQAQKAAFGTVLFGEVESYEKICKKIKAVTKNEVLALAKKIFDEKKMYVAVISPFSKKEILKCLK